MPEIVRQVYASAGYDSLWRPSPEELTIRTDLCLGPLNNGEAEFRSLSDDQAIVTGYAVDLPATNYLPPEHWLANRSAHRLRQLRTERPELGLGPDGKVLVLLEAENGSLRLAGFSVSLTTPPVRTPSIFIVPFFKADRAGAIIAHRLTKAVVLTGAARECLATLAFLPGASEAKIISLCGDAGRQLDAARWGQLLDLSLERSGGRYALTTSLVEIARWGHFTSPGLPWERISLDGSSSGQDDS